MIIDTHTHIYDPGRPEGVPWPPEDDRTLYRRVLPENTREIASPHGVGGTIIVEASDWIEDNDWVLMHADADTFIVGVVGWLDFTSEAFGARLERLAANPLFRGVRAREIPVKELDRPDCLANIRRLGELDLCLDVLAHPEDLDDLRRVCLAAPETRVVIDHIGHVPIDGNSPDGEWRRGMERIADLRNVWCKASGIVEATNMRPAPADLDFYRPTWDFLWNVFGEDRLMFGSNWPVCEINARYADVFAIADAYLAGKGDVARDKVFSANAKASYKWVERL